MHQLAALALSALLATGGSSSPRTAPTVCVAAPTVEGDTDEEARVDRPHVVDSVSSALVEALSKRVRVTKASTCAAGDNACERVHAQRAGAEYLVVVHLAAARADYALTLEVVDVAANEVVASVADVCEICGSAEFDRFARNVGGTLADQIAVLSPDPPTVVVEGKPARALVLLDGATVGVVPWQGTVAPGEHRVSVKHRGYRTEARSVVAVRGSKTRVRVDLKRDPTAKSRALQGLGWSLVAGGSISIGVGAALWSLDGRAHGPSCSIPDDAGRCPNRYASRPGGIALTAIGVVALAAGIGVVIGERRARRRADRARASMRVGPGSIAVHGRF
jgi:hypothetical protein